MVNNIIAALSCALMLREEERGAGREVGVCVCVEDVPATFKNLSTIFASSSDASFVCP